MQPAPQLASYARFISLPRPRAIVQYFEAGPRDKPAIVLIHGLQDEGDTWRHVFEPLAQTNRVIAFDLPGFGRSDKARRSYGVPFFVEAVVALMDVLKINYATLVGNSMGAMIAETIALTHASRVSRLVLVDGTIHIVKRPATNHSLLTQLFFLPTIDKRNFETLRRDPDTAYDTLRPYYAALSQLPEADRTFLYQRVNERVWDEEQRLASLSVQQELPKFFIGPARNLTKRIAKSPVPTTVIWGDHDHIIDIENGRARAALQPGTKLITIEGAGHLPHQERPEKFLAALA
jgi:pimeloyl-ACP methyl ester carboxylesterase